MGIWEGQLVLAGWVSQETHGIERVVAHIASRMLSSFDLLGFKEL